MIPILFAINPCFYEGSPKPAGHEFSTCLQIFVQEKKGEQRPGRARDAYSPLFQSFVQENLEARLDVHNEQTLPSHSGGGWSAGNGRNSHQKKKKKNKRGFGVVLCGKGVGKLRNRCTPKFGDGIALGEVFPWILWNPRGLAVGRSSSFMV